MARLVEEVMNRELFSARPQDLIQDLRVYYSYLGIGSSPVINDAGQLVGMISLRDLIVAPANATVASLMSTPVTTVEAGCDITEAGRILGETGYHRLPVVDSQNRVIGIVSSLDIIRGMTGIPARHPPQFPHFDRDTGLRWSDDIPLEPDRVQAAAQAPGLLAIVHGGAGNRERVVWAEMTHNMRARLVAILASPAQQYPTLRYWLGKKPLRFRVSRLHDRDVGRQVVNKLQRRAGYASGTN